MPNRTPKTNIKVRCFSLNLLNAETRIDFSPFFFLLPLTPVKVEFRKLGMLNEAAESFARSLHIKERELGRFHPSTAKVRKRDLIIREM